jgi:threonine dehydrogenase-like Zn-dependent dehydrogenase
MKAIAVLPGSKDVRLVEQAEPALGGPHDVRLRMLEVGVCGTDREICAFEYGTPPPGEAHLVIGHESLAEVLEVGPAVERLQPGDLVVPTVRRPCRVESCGPCRSGRQDFCSTGEFRERGIREIHGFMSEQVVDHERYMMPVPRELRDCAVLVEPLTIAEKALLQLQHVQSRLPWGCDHAEWNGFGHCHSAVVLGAGPVGLLGAMALAERGFATTVYSRGPADDPKAQLVRDLGCRYVSSASTTPRELMEMVGPLDLVYEAIGLSRVAFELMPVLAPNGVLVLTGVPALRGAASLDLDGIMRGMVLKNQVVLGTVNAARDAFEASITDLARFRQRWPQQLARLITGRFPMQAHRELLQGPATGIKNVIAIAA